MTDFLTADKKMLLRVAIAKPGTWFATECRGRGDNCIRCHVFSLEDSPWSMCKSGRRALLYFLKDEGLQTEDSRGHVTPYALQTT